MKKTILKYSSLIALLGAPLISTQTFAAECVNGANADGCEITADETTYTLTDDISTTANDAESIHIGLFANDNTISQTGNITTTGDNAEGILLQSSDGNNLTIDGNISTNGFQSYGIHIMSDDFNRDVALGGDGQVGNTITMNGNLLIQGENSFGVLINVFADNNNVTINGNTTITGNLTAGLGYWTAGDTLGSGNVMTQNGNITTTGDSSNGLWLFANGTGDASVSNTINMNGSITTTGNGGAGIFMHMNTGQTINMVGDISTQGGIGVSAGGFYTAHGINMKDDNHNNAINLTGKISTSGFGSSAIDNSNGSGNIFNIIGNLTTTGQNAKGLHLLADSDSNSFTINGNIITSGTDGNSEPIALDKADSNNFTLSGAVHSLGGDQAIAVNSTSQNNTFTFKRGVSFIGGLENNGGTTNKLIFDMGKAASYNLDTDGTTWTLEDTSKPIVLGSAKSMGVADIDNQAHVLFRRMDPVNDVLSERQRLYTEGQRPSGDYIDSYYGHDKRDEDYSEISGNAGGVTVGYVLENTETPMEVLVNFEVSQDNYGAGLAKQTTETNSLLAGLFLPAIVEDILGGNLSAKLLVGASDNDAKRTVLNNTLSLSTASEEVSGDYTSAYVSAGAEWFTEFLKVERVTHELSVGTDLVQAYNEDYTAGEYKVDSRDMTQIQSRVLYGMTYKNLARTVDVNTRFGVANQYMMAGDKQDYQINGTSASYIGDDNSFYYTAALGAKYYLSGNTSLYVDTKYGQSSDDIQNLTVDFGFISRF